MKTFLYLCLLFCSVLGFAQSKYFEKNMGWSDVHEGRRIIQKSIDDYIIMGNVLSYTNPSWKAYTMVIDNNGIAQPQIEYSVSENDNSGGYDIINTEYGYAFCGFLENEFSSSQSYLLQTNHEGGIINTLIIGSNVYANVSFSLCRTTDNGYLLAGFINNSNGLHTPYLIKLDSLGVQQWDKTWDNFTDAFSAFVTAQPAKDGSGYYLVGAINNSYSTGDVLLLKIADDGTEIWQAVYGANTEEREVPKTLLQTDDGGFAISYMKTTLPESYSGLLKLNADRTIAWNSDSSFYASSPAEKIIQIANEGYLFAGEYETDPVLLNNLDAEIVRLSASGDILWKRHYGGIDNDYIYDFIPTSDGGYFFVGRTESPDLGVPAGGANVYLLKTNCLGLLTQPQASFTAQIDTATLTTTFQNLSQYTYPDSIDGGHYSWDFGDGTIATQINPTHTYAQTGVYLATLTAVVCNDTSIYIQTICVGSPSFAPLFSYQTNSLTATFINQSTGVTQNQGTFSWNFGDGTASVEQNPMHTYTQSGSYTVELQAIVCSDTLIYRQTVVVVATGILPVEKKMWTISPNPADTQLTINSVKPLSGTFVLYDVLGREVLRQVTTNKQTNIAVAHLPNGLYYCKIGQTVNKLLIVH